MDSRDYARERYEDLARAYRESVMKYDCTSRLDAMRHAVNMPSKRFWITPKRMLDIISMIERGIIEKRCDTIKHEMDMELYRRYLLVKDKPPYNTMRRLDLYDELVHECAPKFYMSEYTALRIYYHGKRERRKHLRSNEQK